MIHAFYASKSGMKNFQYSLNAVSNNLANLNTDGYKAQVVNFSEMIYSDTDTPDGEELEAVIGHGSKASVATDTTPGAIEQSDDPDEGLIEKSNVDLINEMTNMIKSQRGFQINARMVQTADEIEQYANTLR